MFAWITRGQEPSYIIGSIARTRSKESPFPIYLYHKNDQSRWTSAKERAKQSLHSTSDPDCKTNCLHRNSPFGSSNTEVTVVKNNEHTNRKADCDRKQVIPRKSSKHYIKLSNRGGVVWR